MEIVSNNYMPGDPRLIQQIVYELKSQGIFDHFRKECIADVDTKPAYQNLRQRVEGSVATFLNQQTWSPDMNKNQIREQLRKNIHDSGFLDSGVERIVEQVVNPKINSVFLPKVEDVVYRYLGIEKPQRDNPQKASNVDIKDLLPTDLEAVSPESNHGGDKDVSFEESMVKMDESSTLDNSSNKCDEDESPPFEALESTANDTTNNDNSVDSHISGFSGSRSNGDSNQGSDNNKVCQMDISSADSQTSQNSTESRISVVNSEETKMEISEDSQPTMEKPEIHSENPEICNGTPMDVSSDAIAIAEEDAKSSEEVLVEIDKNESAVDVMLEKTEQILSNNNHDEESDEIKSESKSDEIISENKSEDVKSESKSDEIRNESKVDDIKSESKYDNNDESKSRYSDHSGSRDRKDDRHSKSSRDRSKSKHSSSSSKEKEASSSSSSSSNKDKDRESSTSSKSKEYNSSSKDKSRSRDRRDSSKASSKHKDRSRDKNDKEKDKNKTDKERSTKDKNEKEKSDKEKSKDKSDKTERSQKERMDKERNDKDDRDKSVKSDKEKSDRDKSEKSKYKSDRDKSSKDKREKERSKSSNSSSAKHSGSSKDRSSSTSRKDKSSSSSDSKDKFKTSSSSSSNDSKLNRSDSKSSVGDSGDTKQQSNKNDSRSKHRKDEKQSRSSSTNSSKEKKKDKQTSKDDHYSSKDKNKERRSTDRDSNDGNSGRHNNHSSSSSANEKKSSSTTQNNNRVVDASTSSGNGDSSGNSDQTEPLQDAPAQLIINETQPLKYMKPKFASNFKEAIKIMKIRKQIAKLERQNQLSLSEIKVHNNNPLHNGLEESKKDEEKELKELTEQKEEEEEERKPAVVVKTTNLSKESWDALEARLAQEMANVDHNSYGNLDESDLSDNEQTIIEEVRVEVNNDYTKPKSGDNGMEVVMSLQPSIRSESPCRYLEKQSPSLEHNMQFLHNFVAKLEKDVTRYQEISLNNFAINTAPSVACRKRKRDQFVVVDVKNNNKSGYEQTTEVKNNTTLRPPNSAISKAIKDKTNQCTTDIIANECFPLPLSPESDISTDKKEEETITPKPDKKKRISMKSVVAQRYTSEDLYKPRPTITGTRRTRSAKNCQ